MKNFRLSFCVAILVIAFSCEEEKKDPCKGIECENGGTCRDGECRCTANFEGQFCEIPKESNITFTNNTQTTLDLLIDGTSSTLAKGSSVTITGFIGDDVDFHAETSGKTSDGSQVGLKLVWDDLVEVTDQDQSFPLDISSDYFFLKITNSTTYTFETLYVNYGLADQTLDNVTFGTGTFNLGYYKALSNGNARIYIDELPGTYYYWTFSIQTFAGTNNQVLTLNANP